VCQHAMRYEMQPPTEVEMEAGDTECGWPVVDGLLCEVGSAAAAVVVHGGVSTEYCAVFTYASE
jgi:hypothetical protein